MIKTSTNLKANDEAFSEKSIPQRCVKHCPSEKMVCFQKRTGSNSKKKSDSPAQAPFGK